MSELRRDPIRDLWVVIAPERGRRPPGAAWIDEPPRLPENPFAGGMEASTPGEILAYRPAGGAANTPGWTVRVVPNRIPALSVDGVPAPAAVGPYDRLNGIGAHEVIIETPDHEADLADLPPEQVELVIRAWHDRIRDLRRDWRLRYQLILRQYGAAAGMLVAHAHSQLIATPHIPEPVRARLVAARDYHTRHERCLFADVIEFEQRAGERLVAETAHHLAFCPYASRAPFEVMVLPLRQCHDSTLMSEAERLDLARLLIDLLRRLRAALDNPAYQMALINAPSTVPRPGLQNRWESLVDDFRWQLELVPRLAPQPAAEYLAGLAVNPVAPEEAAAFLRDGA